MQQFNSVIAICAVVVLILGLASRRLEPLPVSRPILAVLIGILVGPLGAGWLRPQDWPDAHAILKEAARFALAVSVVGIALRTPVESCRVLLRPVALLLTFGMLLMWAVSSGVLWAVLGLSPLLALALGGALTPTDPVVSSSIVTGKLAKATLLPDRTRSTLSNPARMTGWDIWWLLSPSPFSFILWKAGRMS